MKKIFVLLILVMSISSISFAGQTVCHKMRLGNFQSIETFSGNNFQYLCIEKGTESSTVKIYSGTGKGTLVSEFLGCAEVNNLPTYNPTMFDGTATTFFSPNMIMCKHGLIIAYEKPTNNDKATKLVMGGLRYSIAYTSFELPVVGPGNR